MLIGWDSCCFFSTAAGASIERILVFVAVGAIATWLVLHTGPVDSHPELQLLLVEGALAHLSGLNSLALCASLCSWGQNYIRHLLILLL
jgi:hypothetical protein